MIEINPFQAAETIDLMPAHTAPVSSFTPSHLEANQFPIGLKNPTIEFHALDAPELMLDHIDSAEDLMPPHKDTKKPLMLDQFAIIMRGMPMIGINKFKIGLSANTVSMLLITPFINSMPVPTTPLIPFQAELKASFTPDHKLLKNPFIGSQFL